MAEAAGSLTPVWLGLCRPLPGPGGPQAGPLAQQPAQDIGVDHRELVELLDSDAFVDLMDGRIDRSKLDDLRACWRDEAPIGGAADGRELARLAGDGEYRCLGGFN